VSCSHHEHDLVVICSIEALKRLPEHNLLPKSRQALEASLAAAADYFGLPVEVLCILYQCGRG
jgi:hypothetical protein